MGVLLRMAESVDIVLEGDETGRLRTVLEVGKKWAHSASVSYAGVEVKRLARDVSRWWVLPPGTVLRDEVVLGRSDKYPVADKAGALEAFAEAYASIDKEAGEDIKIRIGQLPMRFGQWRRGRKALGRLARWLWMALKKRVRKASGTESEMQARAATTEVKSKMGSPGRMASMQILVRVVAPERWRAKQIMTTVRSCFQQFNTDRSGNYFKSRGLHVPLMDIETDRMWWRRILFDLRLGTGFFMFTGWTWALSATERMWFWRFATKDVSETKVVKSGGRILDPPKDLPIYIGQPDVLPIGRDRDGNVRGVYLKDTNFMTCTGESGAGKSTWAENGYVSIANATELSQNGLDPHGLSMLRILPYLYEHRERVQLLDVSRRATTVAGWNQIDMSIYQGEGDAEDIAEKVTSVTDSISYVNGWDKSNTRAQTLLRESLFALTAVGLTLWEHPELQPTILQVPSLIDDKKWRDELLPFFNEPQQEYFSTAFDKLDGTAHGPVTQRLRGMANAPKLMAMLGQSGSQKDKRPLYDARRAMDTGQLVLANAAAASSVEADMIAAMFVFDLIRAAKSRNELFESGQEMRQCIAWLDESQKYDDGSIGEAFDEVRKFNLIIAALTLSPTQWTKRSQDSIRNSVSHRFTFTLGDDAAARWYVPDDKSPWARADLARSTLLKLPARRMVGSVKLHGQKTWPFGLDGVHASESHRAYWSEDNPALKFKMMKDLDDIYGRQTVAQVSEHQKTLKRGISNALKKHAPKTQGSNGHAKVRQLANRARANASA